MVGRALRRKRKEQTAMAWMATTEVPWVNEILTRLADKQLPTIEQLALVKAQPKLMRRAMSVTTAPFRLDMINGEPVFTRSRTGMRMPPSMRAAMTRVEKRTDTRPTAPQPRCPSSPRQPPATAVPFTTDERLAFYQSREWRDLRYKALLRSDGRCECCGRSRHDGVKLHVDHIKPMHRYPALRLTLSNLQVLCEDCNMGKGAWN